MRRRILAGATVALFFAPRDGAAQGAALDRLEVADRGSRFFAADSLDFEGKLRVATGVVTTYQHGLRVFGTKQEGSNTKLVADGVTVHPGVAVIMAPGARFAVDVPVMFQHGHDESLAGVVFGAPRSPALGDVRLGVDLRLTGPERDTDDGFVVAGGVSAWLPTGSPEDYTSDGYARVGIRVASAFRSGPAIATARIGITYRRDDIAPFGGVALGSEVNGVAAAGWRAGIVTVGPEVHAVTILRNDILGHRSTPIEGLLGAHANVSDFMVGVGMGTALLRGIGSPGFRALVSVEWMPKPRSDADRDGDGVPDSDDICPDVRGVSTGPARGCPEAPRDLDRDGIVDGEDACADMPGIRTRDPMTSGCPDSDHDGVPDPVDACPNVSGERSPLPRWNGCPPDADGDEIPDVFDACPDVPGEPSTDATTNGCPPPPPPPPDRDKDGIVDDDDKCPDEAGEAIANGCVPVKRDGDKLVPFAPIAFEPGKATLTAASVAPLDALATWLAAHPEIARVRIEARADNRSRLTQDQAQAIADRLVAKGVAKKRLDPVGLGGKAGDKPRVDLRVSK